ncbi:coiled-coil domain-containing protein 175-like [Elgaria multicarinata webbii]|uniref:coiled-coil domain-containing protein 175-like n=1 Tax=Elgaria multicarinata webbii TaxID=159646 RepID=UPI002FCD4AF4
MEPALPPCSESAAAAAALGHLRGVEKQLQNEGLVFDKETVQHLEDAIKAIKELEEERKHTTELWEEETIKNCNLRVRIKGLPDIVMKEFEELVAAAHRFSLHKLSDMEKSLSEVSAAVEAVYSKQQLSEEQNVTLCQEQVQMQVKYEKVAKLVNCQLGEKHALNIQLNELRNLRKQDEEDIVIEENAIEELKEIMASEAIAFTEKKKILEMEIEELRRRLESKKVENEEMKAEYAKMLAMFIAHEKEIDEYLQIISDRRDELGELFKKIKELLKTYEEKKAEKEEIFKKKADVHSNLTSMSEQFDEEREALLQKLEEAEEQLEVVRRDNGKLRRENDLLTTQLQVLIDEEERFCAQRDYLAREFEHLSNLLTERLDLVAKHLVETKTIQDEVDRLQEIYDTSENNYARELVSLELSLNKEAGRRSVLQDQLNDISNLSQKMAADHEEFLSISLEKSENGKKLLSMLTNQNEQLKKETIKSEQAVKLLSAKLLKKKAQYNKLNASLEAEIKQLEEEYNAKRTHIGEMEEELKVNLPLLEKMQIELEGKSTGYSDQQDVYLELQEEQRTLSKSIERSLKECDKLKRLKTQAKNEIKKNRDLALTQLKTFTYSLKFIEKDNYETDRQLYILNAENARLRAGIAYLKEDISTMDSEAKVYQSKRQQIQKDRSALYDIFNKEWIKDDLLHKMFLEYQHDILHILEEHIRRNKKKNDKLVYVHDGLQLNYEAMESLLKSKSTEDDKV